jgi:type VII secretion-associated serine protease mycosin
VSGAIRAAGALLGALLAFGSTPVAHAAGPLPDAQTGCLPPPPGSDSQTPWGIRQLAPARVWPFTTGANTVVAVVDTGVDAGAPQLAGRVLPGIDVVNPGRRPANTDCYGHGTFVAGIVAAAPAAGTGFTGVAPGVTILPVRVATNADDVTSGGLAAGIRAAVDAGARVVNVSASTTAVDPSLAAAVSYAEQRDVVVVASAANSATSGDPVTYPAAYPTVIAVGAIDSNGQLANFSQTGPYLGLVAPGVGVVSIGPGGPGQWQGNGTSYASPFVTGAAALVRAYHPGLTAAQVRHRLEATADHPAAALPDPGYGWGVVDPMAAVTSVLPEEAGRNATAGADIPVRAPVITPSDEVGPLLAILAVVVAAAVSGALYLVSRLVRTGRRRRWRAPANHAVSLRIRR